MDSLKAKTLPLDTCGSLTAGDERTLQMTLFDGSAEKAISTYTNFRLLARREDDGTLIVPNASFTLVDDGLDPSLLGRLNLALVASDTQLIRRGKNVQFMVEATDAGGLKTFFWGCFDEVRDAIA